MQNAARPCSVEIDAPGFNRQAWSELDRDDLAANFRLVRSTTESLTTGLSAEDQNLQSMTEASPVKWHRAHTSWFYETFIVKPMVAGYQEFDPEYSYLFNSYYNGVGRQFPRGLRGQISRPGIDEVAAYRQHIDQAMLALLATCPGNRWEQLKRLTVLGLNHEQQHQELIVTDLKHGFSLNPLHPRWVAPHTGSGRAGDQGWCEFAGGVRHIGADDTVRFCFDNETPVHRVLVDDFCLADRPVTCGEFIEFIEDGGYREAGLWLADGWDWVCRQDIKAPAYWIERDGRWLNYTLAGLREVDPDEALAHVSFYEACAYAQWRGKRLPTEAEWEVAATDENIAGHFADSGRFQPGRAGDGPGLRQLYGDIWEWTSTSYSSYPGFKPAAGAIGEYNGKFMANQMVLRGGSCATPAGHVRPSYRNFFYPEDRWQFSGIRLAGDPCS